MSTVLITGSSSGIGKDTAKHFQQKGWNVIATMRSPEKEQELTDLDNVLVSRLDVTDSESIAQAVGDGVERFGGIDVLVNNAGYGAYGPLEATSMDSVRRQFDTNVIGLLETTKAVLPHFREQHGGTIINISSIGGRMTFPLGSLYHGTKFAVEGISEALHYELEPIGAKVKIVEPGMIATDFGGRSFDFSNDESMAEYQDTVQKVFSAFEALGPSASPPSVVSEVIYAAATDGTDQLRYPAGADAVEFMANRSALDDATFIGGGQAAARALTGRTPRGGRTAVARTRLMIDEQTRSKDVSGGVFIVTGANSGVGLETTRQLVTQGGHVVMACRRPDAGREAAESLGGLRGSSEVMTLDLADLESVRDFVGSFLDGHDRLDGLACNAGMVDMSPDRPRYTEDGFEMTMAASFFGHFLLTESLLDVLKDSAPSRMLIVSSVVHAGRPGRRPELHLEDLNFTARDFNNFAAYAEAKLAAVLYAKELGERLDGTGVSAFSVHPGWARSNFGSGGGFLMRSLMSIARPLTRWMSDSNEESAQTSLHCLLSDDAPNHSGSYFSQSSVLYRDRASKAGGWPMESPNPNAHDIETARRLVQVSSELVGLGTA